MIPSSLPSKEETARLTAKILLDIGAVHLNTAEPFTHASGLKAPTYVDCRKIISFPRARSLLMDYLAATVMRDVGPEAFTNISGGETAGIPFGAFMAERLALPMTYVRKKPKGYGRNARIEGLMGEADRVLLVEDMATDGGSKLSFVQAIRDTGAACGHAAVIFYYDIFEDALAKLDAQGIRLHWLCTWWDVLKEAEGRFDPSVLTEVRDFLKSPIKWRESRGFPSVIV
jgi:orotate phosphoribosyltransferase